MRFVKVIALFIFVLQALKSKKHIAVETIVNIKFIGVFVSALLVTCKIFDYFYRQGMFMCGIVYKYLLLLLPQTFIIIEMPILSFPTMFLYIF